MTLATFSKISENTSPHAAIILRGLGTRGYPHPDFVSFLVERGLEVYNFDRESDWALASVIGAIEQYQKELREAVNLIVNQGKVVHLVGISFGAYLALKAAESTRDSLASIAAIAPIIDPYRALMSKFEKDHLGNYFIELGNGEHFHIGYVNVIPLQNQIPKNIDTPGTLILGNNDEFEKQENLEKVCGNHLSKHILEGVKHEETTGHAQTRRILQEFYEKIFQIT